MSATTNKKVQAAKIVGAVLIAVYATVTSTGCMRANPPVPVAPQPVPTETPS